MTSENVRSDSGVGTPLVPFLKWAGGKRWFAERYTHLLPSHYDRYIEPFLGGGAMFFALQPKHAILSDLNEELINCYRAVRESPVLISDGLSRHHDMHSELHYYSVRSSDPIDYIDKAVRFLYLNRTCWNGLYRVNLKNEFNVPIGTKSSVILPSDDFVKVSNSLLGAVIVIQDFEKTLDLAQENDFVFVDPPYTVKHNMNGFVKYNDRIFSWNDQLRLRDAVVRAADRGALILVTNANHASIREIYKGVGRLNVVERASVLAANSIHRTLTEELAIQTWISEEVD